MSAPTKVNQMVPAWIAILFLLVSPMVAPSAEKADYVRGTPSSGEVRSESVRQPASTLVHLKPVFLPLVFDDPIGVFQAPNDSSTWFVAEREGYIRRFQDGDAVAAVFADLDARITSESSERGLLGLAFHPLFPATPRMFLSYTNDAGESVISRFDTSQDGQVFLPNSETILLTVAQPFTNHNGGNMAFGPDGYLYIGIGDGGSSGDPTDQAQNTNSLLGAILRIDVDTGNPYGIPADNPFSSSAACGEAPGCPEIFAYGFRNPWRWSFDRLDGLLWAGDVGQSDYEEIDIVELGNNYGWRCYEGMHPYNLTDCGPANNYTFPVAEYDHASGDCAITGGYVYRGSEIPGLYGVYIYGDYCSGRIWGLFNEGEVLTSHLLADSEIRISSFGEGNDGEIYVIGYSDGRIYRLSRGAAFAAGAILVPLLLQ